MPTQKKTRDKMNDLSSILTAAERTAVKNGARRTLLTSIQSEMEVGIEDTVRRILREEARAAMGDEKFRAQMRAMVRAAIKKEADRIANSVEVTW